MTAASKATIVPGFPLAGPTCSAITSIPVQSRVGDLVLRGGCDRFVLAAVLPHRPGDASELVREPHRCLVVVTPLLKGESPRAEPIVGGRLPRMTEHRTGPMHQEQAQVGISSFRNPSQPLALTARILAWGQSEVAREVPA